MRGLRPLARAAIERSGFWRDPSANVLQDSPAKRVDATREREVSALHLDQLTLKHMRHQNPIDAENGGSCPKWGSTTSGTTFCEHQSSHDRFREIDRSLIGSRESTSFSRQRVAISEGRIEDPISTAHDCYRPKELARSIHIPNHTVMEPSGFATAAIPTQIHVAKMSEVTAADLPAATVAEMRRKNTPEYQNLFEPSPYLPFDSPDFFRPSGCRIGGEGRRTRYAYQEKSHRIRHKRDGLCQTAWRTEALQDGGNHDGPGLLGSRGTEDPRHQTGFQRR
jgi:hypothetical protein